MDIGYIRVKNKADLILYTNQLEEYGCEMILHEIPSDKITREQFDTLKLKLRNEIDRIVIPSIFMFPLPTLEMIDFIADLNKRHIQFVSLSEDINTATAFHFNSYAKTAKKLRGNQILSSNRARGKNGGRKPGIKDEAKIIAMSMAEQYKSKDKTVEEIMEIHKVRSKRTFYKYLRLVGVQIDSNKRRN